MSNNESPKDRPSVRSLVSDGLPHDPASHTRPIAVDEGLAPLSALIEGNPEPTDPISRLENADAQLDHYVETVDDQWAEQAAESIREDLRKLAAGDPDAADIALADGGPQEAPEDDQPARETKTVPVPQDLTLGGEMRPQTPMLQLFMIGAGAALVGIAQMGYTPDTDTFAMLLGAFTMGIGAERLQWMIYGEYGSFRAALRAAIPGGETDA